MRTVSVIALMFLILSYTVPAEGDSERMNVEKQGVAVETAEDEEDRSMQAQPALYMNLSDAQIERQPQLYQISGLEPAVYENTGEVGKQLINRSASDLNNIDQQQVELVVMSESENTNAQKSAQAEAEHMAQIDFDVKAQAETAAKAQAGLEAKIQAEADAKAKIEAEAKAKAQAEAEAKAQAEAKAKAQAEAEAKAQAEAEAKNSKKITARVTAYAPFDNHSGICNDGNPNVTSTGQKPGPNIIAVDPKKIPYGTKLKIEGFDRIFVAGDTGSALRRYNGVAIDVFFDSYNEARRFGVQYLKIEIIEA